MKEYQYGFNSAEIKTIYKFLDALREQGGHIAGFDPFEGCNFYLSKSEALFYVEQKLEFFGSYHSTSNAKLIAWINKEQLDHQCRAIKKNKLRCKNLIEFGHAFREFNPNKMYCDLHEKINNK